MYVITISTILFFLISCRNDCTGPSPQPGAACEGCKVYPPAK